MSYNKGCCNRHELLGMVTIHPQKIIGRWQAGYALDLHTTSSTPIGQNEAGHLQFDTVRPEIAELLKQLKYDGKQDTATGIIEAAAAFLSPHRDKFDILVPVPSSKNAVLVLARGIGVALNLPVVDCITATRATTQLKNEADPEKRKELVKGLYAVDAAQTTGKNVLQFDDVFRSGTTMNEIADVLLGPGKAASVRALAITKTRSNR